MDKDLNDIANTNMDFVFTDEEKTTIVNRALIDIAPFNEDLNEWEQEFIFDMEVRHSKDQPITGKQIRKLMQIHQKFV